MLEYLIFKALQDWKDAKVVCVPGVMLRLLLGTHGENEYRINWFKDANETYIHNHTSSFTTMCLAGNYTETTWEIDDSVDDVTYVFEREVGGSLSVPIPCAGGLRVKRMRRHFPGNIMSVDKSEYHSICAAKGEEALTVVVRNTAECGDTRMLATTPFMDPEATQKVRPATECERKVFFERLVRMFEES